VWPPVSLVYNAVCVIDHLGIGPVGSDVGSCCNRSMSRWVCCCTIVAAGQIGAGEVFDGVIIPAPLDAVKAQGRIRVGNWVSIPCKAPRVAMRSDCVDSFEDTNLPVVLSPTDIVPIDTPMSYCSCSQRDYNCETRQIHFKRDRSWRTSCKGAARLYS